eukprot:1720359-Rhodomonas_salina.1
MQRNDHHIHGLRTVSSCAFVRLISGCPLVGDEMYTTHVDQRKITADAAQRKVTEDASHRSAEQTNTAAHGATEEEGGAGEEREKEERERRWREQQDLAREMEVQTNANSHIPGTNRTEVTIAGIWFSFTVSAAAYADTDASAAMGTEACAPLPPIEWGGCGHARVSTRDADRVGRVSTREGRRQHRRVTVGRVGGGGE